MEESNPWLNDWEKDESKYKIKTKFIPITLQISHNISDKTMSYFNYYTS